LYNFLIEDRIGQSILAIQKQHGFLKATPNARNRLSRLIIQEKLEKNYKDR